MYYFEFQLIHLIACFFIVLPTKYIVKFLDFCFHFHPSDGILMTGHSFSSVITKIYFYMFNRYLHLSFVNYSCPLSVLLSNIVFFALLFKTSLCISWCKLQKYSFDFACGIFYPKILFNKVYHWFWFCLLILNHSSNILSLLTYQSFPLVILDFIFLLCDLWSIWGLITGVRYTSSFMCFPHGHAVVLPPFTQKPVFSPVTSDAPSIIWQTLLCSCSPFWTLYSLPLIYFSNHGWIPHYFPYRYLTVCPNFTDTFFWRYFSLAILEGLLFSCEL